MFWKKNRITKTLVFKLTFQYLALYLVLNTVLAFIIYREIKAFQENRIDKQLVANIKSVKTNILNSSQGYNYKFCELSAAEGADNSLYILTDSLHEIIQTSYINPWGDLENVINGTPKLPVVEYVSPLNIEEFKPWSHNSTIIVPTLLYKEYWDKNFIICKTVFVEKLNTKARIGYMYFPNGNILISGLSLKDNFALLKQVRKKVFIFLLLSISFGALIGVYITKKSMRDVIRITNAVNKIQKGNLSIRVDEKNNSEEINNMALAFNDMLSRIEILIKEQKQLTDDIAHDLRSPLTGIRGFAETGLTNDMADNNYLFSNIISESDRLTNIVNSTLEISEIETGVYKNTSESFDINKLLCNAVDLLTPLAEQKEVVLTNNILSESAIINANKHMIQRAVSNIIDNAIKFTPDGGVVKVSSIKDNKNIEIIIEDSGIGMQENELEKIFDKFYKADKSRNTSGNGLGLSIAKAYIAYNKGSIRIRSIINKGSNFTITLPITE